MIFTVTVPSLASLGDATISETILFLWHRTSIPGHVQSLPLLWAHSLAKCCHRKPMTMNAHDLASLGDATQIETILFVSHRKMNCRQVQSSSLLWAFSLAKCFHKNSTTVTATVPALASLGDATLSETILFVASHKYPRACPVIAAIVGTFIGKVLSQKAHDNECTCLGLISWCNTNWNNPICVSSQNEP